LIATAMNRIVLRNSHTLWYKKGTEDVEKGEQDYEMDMERVREYGATRIKPLGCKTTLKSVKDEEYEVDEEGGLDDGLWDEEEISSEQDLDADVEEDEDEDEDEDEEEENEAFSD